MIIDTVMGIDMGKVDKGTVREYKEAIEGMGDILIYRYTFKLKFYQIKLIIFKYLE